MKKSLINLGAMVAKAMLFLGLTNSVQAEDVHWITGPGNGTEVETRYGTATQPLLWFDSTKWFTDTGNPQTPNGNLPVDGQSVAHTNSCCNPEP